MKSDHVKLQLPGLLFDELAGDEREEVLAHLSECDECHEEWEALKRTTRTMREWQEDMPPSEMVLVPGNRAKHLQRLGGLPFLSGALKWGIAAAVVLLALWIAKPSVSYSRGDFRLAFGEVDPEQTGSTSPVELERRLREERMETVKLMSEMVAQTAEQQTRLFTRSLGLLFRELDLRRQDDLERIATAVADVRRSSTRGLERTNRMLQDFIRAASFGPGGSGRSGQ